MDDKTSVSSGGGPDGWQTPGRDALVVWIATPGHSQHKLSKALGIRQQLISNWVRGVHRPDYANMVAIELICGISPSEWLTAEERHHIASLRSMTFRARLSASESDPPPSEE